MAKIVLRLDGGLVYVISAPPGIEVEVHDYDCDGHDEEELKKDTDGAFFISYELDT